MNIDISSLKGLLSAAGAPSPFPDTLFPYPVIQGLFGVEGPQDVRKLADAFEGGSLEEQLALALGLAELNEAAASDKDQFFISDRELRSRLVRLNSTTGWALIWGDSNDSTKKLAALLEKEDFQIYTVSPGGAKPMGKQAKGLGSRTTSSIYFYQALVRYPHIYGRIPRGDVHQTVDFIEDYGPAVMFLARGALSPVEEALFLGGLFLGIPAVVPSSFPLPYGNLLRADDPAAAVQQALRLPNLRVRRRLRFQVNIPFSFDPAFSSQQIDMAKCVGGTPLSSFVVVNEDKGDGIEIKGELGSDIGIEIALGDPMVDITMTEYVEEFAARLPGYIEGVSAEVRQGCPTVRWREDVPLEAGHLGQAYYSGLKAHFSVERVKVSLVFSPDSLGEMKQQAQDFREKRRQAIAAATEETEPFFYACTRCHSFALEHACTITPERPSQCGTRSWSHVKARATLSNFDASGLGPRRSGSALQGIIVKGQCLDADKGEYSGVNAATELLSDGRTRRVFLHSLLEHPHTACSCFQGMAFYVPDVDGIGLIDRAFAGVTPDGRDWDSIANAAAGKQTSGYAAFGKDYLRSPKFLQGDGGWSRVVWMPRRLKDDFASDRAWIATEADVSNIQDLEKFVQSHRTRQD
ncbi:MAG: hypothetical protein HY671_03345 [Chloroflexi bacterium]|nr:hypothetical protein [Chloroflexota bacterium]